MLWDEGTNVCRLCAQAFGEIRELKRAPNGNVYVDFKNANVADTVRSLPLPRFFFSFISHWLAAPPAQQLLRQLTG